MPKGIKNSIIVIDIEAEIYYGVSNIKTGCFVIRFLPDIRYGEPEKILDYEYSPKIQLTLF